MANNYQIKPQEQFRLARGEQRLLLVIGDFIAACLALGAALLFWAQGDTWFGLSLEFLRSRIPGWFYFLPLLWTLLMVDTYDVSKASNSSALNADHIVFVALVI